MSIVTPDGGPSRSARSREAVLAEFSQFALTSFDLYPILKQACILMARGLDAPIAKLAEYLPESEEFVLRAQVGLAPDLAVEGETRVPGDNQSAMGYTLKVGGPVVSHIADETRFQPSEIVRRSGVQTSVNVPIPTLTTPFGVLEIDSLERREFTDEDVDFMRVYAGLVGAAVERQRASATARALAEQREVLLRELQHRVKNDLQVITALVTLAARKADTPASRALIEDIGGRAQALHLIHSQLYATGSTDRIDASQYLSALARERLRLHGWPARHVRLDLDLVPLELDHERAITLGLIANEFLTNSLKYAFPFGRGTIRVALDREGRRARLQLADDGIGISELPAEHRGTGRELILLLAQKISAGIAWGGPPGTSLTVDFPP